MLYHFIFLLFLYLTCHDIFIYQKVKLITYIKGLYVITPRKMVGGENGEEGSGTWHESLYLQKCNVKKHYFFFISLLIPLAQ